MANGVGVHIKAPVKGRFSEIVTPEAMEFVAALHRKFNPRRNELLGARLEWQRRFDKDQRLDFLPETKRIRETDWTVTPPPNDLRDRRVEIVGGVDSKTIITALNAGANVFVADFENSTAPTWEKLIEGQINLYDTIRGHIAWEDEETGVHHAPLREMKVLAVQPRGWHREERHVFVDDVPVSASVFDFGLYCFHHARDLLQRGTGPYFYLPKIESYLEARLWNEIFSEAQQQLNLPRGSIRAMVVIETVNAAFQIHEILWELRDHAAGICCSREGYLFSLVKAFAKDKRFILPDRESLTMTMPLMRACSRLCVETGHRRRVSVIGNVNATLPIENDPNQQERTAAELRIDAENEVADGYDLMPTPNQTNSYLSSFTLAAADLIQASPAEVTEVDVQQNVALGLGYVEAWLRGIGCVSLFHRMESTVTAELSHALLWQWVHHGAGLFDGREVDVNFVENAIKHELARVKPTVGMERYRAFMRAAELMREIVRADNIIEYLAISGYPRILEREHYPVV